MKKIKNIGLIAIVILLTFSEGTEFKKESKPFKITFEVIFGKPPMHKFIFDEHSDLRLKVTLCNQSSNKLFLPFFYTSETYLRFLRFDSTKGFTNYTDIFIGNRTSEALARDSIYKPVKHVRNHFADSVVKSMQARSIKVRNGKQIDETYAYLQIDGARYLLPNECAIDTVDLNSLKSDGGHFKIFVYAVRDQSMRTSDREYGKFLEDNIPSTLKGYEKWKGTILSDTLAIYVDKDYDDPGKN